MGPLLATLITCLAAPLPAPDFLDAFDIVWERPPERWLTGVPLANGDIGALIWGDGAPLKLTLDKYDTWETRELPLDLTYKQLRRFVESGDRKNAEECMRTESLYGDAPRPTRLPMPRLEIDFGAPFKWDLGRLRLHSATAEISGEAGGDAVKIEAFVHANENVIQLRMTGPGAMKAKPRVSLDHLNAEAKKTLKNWGYTDPEVIESDDSGSLVLKAPTGYQYAVAWKKTINGADVILTLAILSTSDDHDPLSAAKALASKGVDLQNHLDWWKEYWNRSFLRVPDARLEALYYAEMYKLGCVSRPGKLPITLQGLWTLDGGMPPWAGDYHLDMNVQQSYWPIYAANRLELGEPLYRTFSACIPRWREQCKAFFGCDGLWAGCAIGPKGERIYGYSGVELWPGNVAWLAHHYWLHFLYSRDKAFLRDQALPMLELSFLTYANILEKGDDGKLHVPMSYSPEYREGSADAYCKDPNCDLALIRFLAKAIMDGCNVLGVNDEASKRAEDVEANLVDYQKDGARLRINDNVKLDHSHRHHSHLMAIHPLGLVTLDGSNEDKAMIRESLHEIRVKGTGEWTGWSFPWMSLLASRGGYGNMAWRMLDTYVDGFITPNTFHINGDPRVHGSSLFEYEPMTLEAGFGAAAAVMEMLIQSQNGCIRLFPTIPDQWHDAYFADLRAEGAFIVTAKLEKGETLFASITSEAGEPCKVKNPFGGDVELSEPDNPNAAPKVLRGDILTFDTKPGTRYLLHPAGKQLDPTTLGPTTFNRTQDEINFFGVKQLARF